MTFKFLRIEEIKFVKEFGHACTGQCTANVRMDYKRCD